MYPFFQGKVDNFCAIYAVINAIHLLHPLSSAKAREILNDTLLEAAKSPSTLLRVLNHLTDYNELVDTALKRWQSEFGYEHAVPLGNMGGSNRRIPAFSSYGRSADSADSCDLTRDMVWNLFRKFAQGKNGSSIVFRFCRFLPGSPRCYVDHWSTAVETTASSIQLFDCSLEASGLYSLPRDSIFLAEPGSIPPIGARADAIRVPHPECRREYIVIAPECLHAVWKKNHSPFMNRPQPLAATAADAVRTVPSYE